MIIFSLLLTVSFASFSQQTTASTQLPKQDYLQKSKHQKTAAWIMMGGGAALFTTGGVIGAHGFFDFYTFDLNNANKNLETGGILILVGSAAMLGSIPLFIASGKNKKKGMSLSFKNETVPKFYKENIVLLPLPSVSVKINL